MIGVNAQGIQVPALTIHWYAIFVVLGVWIGTEVAARLSKQVGQEPENVWRALVWVLIGSLFGARLWYVLFPPVSSVENGFTANWLLSHFSDLTQGAVAIWSGGLSLIGAIFGGSFGLFLFTRKHNLPFAVWLDLATVALPLAQAVGRVGSLINQDLYGPPTNLPWGILINDVSYRFGPYTDLAKYPLETTRFHPTAIYELVLALIIFLALQRLFRLNRSRLQAGDIALLYVAVYGVGRFLLEFVRVNNSYIGNINVSQTVAGSAAVVAALMLLRRHRTPGRSLYSPISDSAGGKSNQTTLNQAI
jgi:phosphatidylglycerol---prolipoprotein diacylglyceryl transferase